MSHTLKSINPYTGEKIDEYPVHSMGEVDEIVTKTKAAWKEYREMRPPARAVLLKKLADLLLDREEELAKIITTEMGKLKKESIAEVEKCAWVCNYYADNGPSFLEKEIIEADYAESYVTFNPLGVVLAIMPWNFPFWQTFRFLAPALMSGNGALLKHSANVQGCAFAVEELVREAGFPENIFRVIKLKGKDTSEVIKHHGVSAVTLTGSVAAGKSAAEVAGSVLKKTVMELGGSDAYVVLEDADLEKAVDLCVKSRMLNNGQSCIAAKRFIVDQKIYYEFSERFTEKMRNYKFGDPWKDDTLQAPMVTKELRDDLHKQVQDSVDKGAKLLCGGEIPDKDGFFYPATVLSSVKPGMPAYSEELFGPVATIFNFSSLTEAIQIANDTSFGLGAAVFTSDIGKGKWLANKGLEAGCIFVNDFVKSDPRLPFGGVKESGYGRELSIYGMREFVNIKSVVIS